MSESETREFQDRLTGFLPKLRVWALGLTRNRPAAEDLVQDVAVKVLLAKIPSSRAPTSRRGYTGS